MAANAQHITQATEEKRMSLKAGGQDGHYMKRILLVDNQAHVLRVMKLSLDRNGYEVDTALSGEVALNMMAEEHYDVVISDHKLEKMNGPQFFASIEERFGSAGPLKFLITDEHMDSADNDGAWASDTCKSELIEKPISLRWLIARLNEFFGHYKTA